MKALLSSFFSQYKEVGSGTSTPNSERHVSDIARRHLPFMTARSNVCDCQLRDTQLDQPETTMHDTATYMRMLSNLKQHTIKSASLENPPPIPPSRNASTSTN
eukprot:4919515-Pyramimonas_sp.AAC.1